MNFKAGDKVEFNPKVYKAPYAPYYDSYQGETFEIVVVHIEEPYGAPEHPHIVHIELKCISDPELIVAGNVHPDELEVL
jgi:hypothetical protein